MKGCNTVSCCQYLKHKCDSISLKLMSFDAEQSNNGYKKVTENYVNGSQVAKMEKYSPHMSLP